MFARRLFSKRAATGACAASIAAFAASRMYGQSYAEENKRRTKDDEYTEDDHAILMKIRPDFKLYERIDWWMEKEEYAHFIKDHAVHDTLDGSSKIESYEIYRHREQNELFVIVKFGSALNGHQEIVHGGISALILDNSYGWLFMAAGFPPAFTANLVLNYRSPIRKDSFSILKAKVDKFEGRKLHMTATIEDALTGRLQVESSTLFITMKK